MISKKLAKQSIGSFGQNNTNNINPLNVVPNINFFSNSIEFLSKNIDAIVSLAVESRVLSFYDKQTN